MFIVGVALSAIFTTIEYRYLDTHHADHRRMHRYLKASYIFKIVIVSIEIALAIAFAVTLYKHKYDAAGVLEWLVSFLLTFYLLSFAVDLWPAAHATKGAFVLQPIANGNGHVVGTGFAHELGHTGGATAVGFGQDARAMQPNGHNAHVGIQNFDETGRPQHTV